MIGLNHALAGIGIALSVRDPLLVAPIALASHFLLDIVPHFHHESFGNSLNRPYTKILRRIILLDTFASISVTSLALFFWPHLWFVIIIGVLFAMLPDFLWPLYGKIHQLEKFFHFHLNIQRFERPWGILFEAPFSFLLIAIIYL